MNKENYIDEILSEFDKEFVDNEFGLTHIKSARNFLKQKLQEVIKKDRERILELSAEAFHPYCGKPSCYDKLVKIIKN